MPVISMTEDQVRDKAKELLNLNETSDAKCGAGQITTFNMLGFQGVTDKPDGWYLPKNVAKPALVLETKASHVSLGDKQVDELQKNVRIVGERYSKVIGILYNGNDVRVFNGKDEIRNEGGYCMTKSTTSACSMSKDSTRSASTR